MSTSLSNLVNNLSERVLNDKCTDCKSYLDYMSIKNKKIIFRCFECKKNHEKDFVQKLIRRFTNTYKFCNGDLNKFILLLRKGVYLYEYMDSWKRIDETSLPDKKDFYSNLNISQMLIIDMQKEYSMKLHLKILVIIMICMFKVIHYCFQMCLKILEKHVLKYMN